MVEQVKSLYRPHRILGLKV